MRIGLILFKATFDFFDQFMGRNVQRLSDFEKSVDSGASQAALNFAVVCSVKTGKTAQNFLRHSLFISEPLNHSSNQFSTDHGNRPLLSMIAGGA